MEHDIKWQMFLIFLIIKRYVSSYHTALVWIPFELFGLREPVTKLFSSQMWYLLQWSMHKWKKQAYNVLWLFMLFSHDENH